MATFYQDSLFEGTEESMLNKSITLLRDMEPIAVGRNPMGYAVGYSGGKDSDVLIRIFEMSGVKYFVFHNHTTLDAPETVYYVRRRFAEMEAKGIHCVLGMPRKSFWQLCVDNEMLPLRQMRFCCKELKEHDPAQLASGCVRSFGVRKAEGARRAANRDSIETATNKKNRNQQRFHFDNTEDAKEYLSEGGSCDFHKMYTNVNPLAYWSTPYLMKFIESEHLTLNPLYERGHTRVGCIGCPMAGKGRIEQFREYPKYRDRYLMLCEKIIAIQKKKGKLKEWVTAEDFLWSWILDMPGLRFFDERPEELKHVEW